MTNAEMCIQWIKEYFDGNPNGKAIIGISGGKDSTVAAALCVEALGADRVIGVLMPNGEQTDIADAREVCQFLEIDYHEINIGSAYNNLMYAVQEKYTMRELPPIVTTNTPARLRMTVLYMVAGMHEGSRVVNTCNRSEDFVGYSTKYGDAAGDFSPLGHLTVREVLEIGDELGLPHHLVHKAPSDGMCGKTDEDNLGFTYNELDNFILGTGKVKEETKDKIMALHNATRHKYRPIPTFNPILERGIVAALADVEQFDYSKQYKRGLRAESGVMDEAGTFTTDPYYQEEVKYNGVGAGAKEALEKMCDAIDRFNEKLEKRINNNGN